MNNVHSRVELTTQTDHQLNRFILRHTRPRSQKTLIISAANHFSFDRLRQLRVNDQKRTQPRQLRHRLTQIFLSHMLKLIDAGRYQKTLKPHHTRFKHRRELGSVSRHYTTPKPDIDKTITTRRLQLSLKSSERRRWRNRIERHIDKRRHATCRRRERRTAKPFPLSPSRRI